MADNKIWSVDLSQGSGPLYRRLADSIATAIETGELRVGDRLPPQRQLAWHLDINLSTVTKAFHEATQRHLIYGEVGRGTYVLAQSKEADLFALKQAPTHTLIDLSTHMPSAQPGDQDLQRTLSAMMSESPGLGDYLAYHSPVALQRIRIACAQWLSTFDYHISPGHCIATSSAQNALTVTLLACCRHEDTVLVDELTFPGVKAVAKQLGLKLQGVAMDHRGIIPDALDLAVRSTGARVLVSDPAQQNPTGSSMDQPRQQQFIDVIRHHKLLFIEEHVLGTLSMATPVSNSIKDQSILITGLAKAVAPGLRVAMIASEHPLIDRLNGEYHATSWQLSPLLAEVACRWIEDGTALRRLNWQRSEIERRYRLLKALFPDRDYAIADQPCGHAWLEVNGHADAIAARCSQLGVEVVAASLFAVGRHCPDNIRISLSAASSLQQLKVALNRIKEAGLVRRTGNQDGR